MRTFFHKLLDAVGFLMILAFMASITMLGGLLDSNASIKDCVPWIITLGIVALMSLVYSLVEKE